MAVITIKDDLVGDLVLDETGTTWKLLEDVLVYGQVRSIGTPDVNLIVNGIISSPNDVGFDISSTSASVTIGRTGRVAVESMVFSGADAVLKNNGQIIATAGIVMSGDGAQFINNATMASVEAVTFSGNEATFTNTAKGVVFVPIDVQTEAGEVTTIINHGRLDGPVTFEGNGVAQIVSDGVLSRTVQTDGGDDILDLRGSTISSTVRTLGGADTIDLRLTSVEGRGVIRGGLDDDTYRVSVSDIDIAEDADEGTDLVESTATFTLPENFEDLTLIGRKNVDATGNAGSNELRGNAGDNDLSGLDGSDFLHGGKGSDRLTGGERVDTFVFSTGDGRDTIVDYLKDSDLIDLSGWEALSNFADMRDNHTSFSGGNMIIRAGKDQLTILGVGSLDELAEADFVV